MTLVAFLVAFGFFIKMKSPENRINKGSQDLDHMRHRGFEPRTT